MLLSLILYFTLIIPITLGSSPSPTNDSVIIMDNNRTKDHDTMKIGNVTIITEGGSPVQSTPVTLPKPNITLPIIDAVVEKDKSIEESSTSKVKPRKGVVYDINSSTEDKQLKEVNVSHVVKGETQASPLPHNNSTKSHVLPQNNMHLNEVHINSTTKVAVTTTPRPKKPLVLSNEALDKMAIQNIDFKTFEMSSDKNGPAKKVAPMNASRHPGMVMPIVITILVVPMFAVLGYMALRRGQEAWKNRHYKRMDFLLDGMYNE